MGAGSIAQARACAQHGLQAKEQHMHEWGPPGSLLTALSHSWVVNPRNCVQICVQITEIQVKNQKSYFHKVRFHCLW